MNNLKLKTNAFMKKNGTKVAFYGGMGSIAIGCGLLCKATLKINSMAEQDAKKIADIRKKWEEEDGNSRLDSRGPRRGHKLCKQGRRELSNCYLRTGARYCLTAAPAAILILGGMGACTYAFNKEHNGRMQMTGVAMGYLATLNKYRKKYADEHGEEAEKKFYYGVKEEEKEVKDEKGKVKKVKEEGLPKDVDISDFAKFFGKDYSDAATGYPEADLIFLKNIERAATRKLARDKWLTLNEVYKMLELRDGAGQRYGVKGGNNIGWVYNKDNPEENQVDFGLFNLKKTENKDYINGYNDVILIEPNINCLDLGNAMWGLDDKTPDPMIFQE